MRPCTSASFDIADRDALAAFLAEYRAAALAPDPRRLPRRGRVARPLGLGHDRRRRRRPCSGPRSPATWNLHELLADEPLDHFVLFSSAAGLLGLARPGQLRRGQRVHGRRRPPAARPRASRPCTVNWGAWAAGMADRDDLEQQRGRQGQHAIPVDARHGRAVRPPRRRCRPGARVADVPRPADGRRGEPVAVRARRRHRPASPWWTTGATVARRSSRPPRPSGAAMTLAAAAQPHRRRARARRRRGRTAERAHRARPRLDHDRRDDDQAVGRARHRSEPAGGVPGAVGAEPGRDAARRAGPARRVADGVGRRDPGCRRVSGRRPARCS